MFLIQYKHLLNGLSKVGEIMRQTGNDKYKNQLGKLPPNNSIFRYSIFRYIESFIGIKLS